jgi:GNAT superfamily N-acetyltransferase
MLDRVYTSMRQTWPLLGDASEGARALELPGVLALVVPACPERAVFNSVLYEDVNALADAYDEIAAAYDEAGANWTVWVRHGDREAPALLERRGHVLDSEPEAMARGDLGAVERPAFADFTPAGRIADVGPINDRAYGFDTDSCTRALAGFPEDRARVYTSGDGGRPVACLMVVDVERNADVTWVAVLPEARGRGLSGKLLAHALADAAERGCETTTLVATKMGQPTYERLGYEALGALQLWEQRTANPVRLSRRT